MDHIVTTQWSTWGRSGTSAGFLHRLPRNLLIYKIRLNDDAEAEARGRSAPWVSLRNFTSGSGDSEIGPAPLTR